MWIYAKQQTKFSLKNRILAFIRKDSQIARIRNALMIAKNAHVLLALFAPLILPLPLQKIVINAKTILNY